MAKAAWITDDVDTLIADVFKEHPKWTAKQVKKEVTSRLRKKDKTTPLDRPSLSYVQKVLTGVRNNLSRPDPQDTPWHLAAFEMTPCAVPLVLDVWKMRLSRQGTFTIREAKWAARLSVFLKEDTARLSSMAGKYALEERLNALVSRPFNSSGLDRELVGLDMLPKQAIGRAELILEVAQKPNRVNAKRRVNHARSHNQEG